MGMEEANERARWFERGRKDYCDNVSRNAPPSKQRAADWQAGWDAEEVDQGRRMFLVSDSLAPRCRDCRWWGRRASGEQDTLAARCHAVMPALGVDGYGVWPVTAHDDWCGAFERTENDAEA